MASTCCCASSGAAEPWSPARTPPRRPGDLPAPEPPGDGQGGFTPYEALRTATANPAQRMGLGTQLGTVSVGALADFVCVEGDPLSDINAAARVRSVVVGGVARTVATLMEPFTSTAAGPAAAAPTNRTARSLVSAEAQDTHGWHDPRPNATGCLC
ncbi:amidohydrolase family protein [Streptomyces nojiriensis]